MILIAVIKYQDQINFKTKGFVLAHKLIPQFITDGSQGRNTWRQPGCRSRCRGHGGMLLIALFLMVCSACSYTTQGCLPRDCPTHRELGAPASICNQENAPQPRSSIYLLGHFLNWDSLFLNDPSLCQADIKLSRSDVEMVQWVTCLTPKLKDLI